MSKNILGRIGGHMNGVFICPCVNHSTEVPRDTILGLIRLATAHKILHKLFDVHTDLEQDLLFSTLKTKETQAVHSHIPWRCWYVMCAHPQDLVTKNLCRWPRPIPF